LNYLFQQYPEDAGITAINYPLNDTATGSLVYAEVTITNFGTNPLTSIPLALRLDGIVVAQETWSGNLMPQSNTGYTFTTSYTAPGSSYQLCASTLLPGDPATYNDATCKNFGSLPALNDVGISQIIAPAPGNICFYHGTSQPWYQYPVTVRIANYGQNPQTSIPVAYEFNTGGQVHTDTWIGNLASGSWVDYSLTTLFQPIQGVQLVCVETQLAGDVVPANDKSCESYIGTDCIGIDDPEISGLLLYQNIPNPTSGSTIIPYQLPNDGMVRFGLVNLLGQPILVRRFLPMPA
jgi:hypothetical protein